MDSAVNCIGMGMAVSPFLIPVYHIRIPAGMQEKSSALADFFGGGKRIFPIRSGCVFFSLTFFPHLDKLYLVFPFSGLSCLPVGRQFCYLEK